MFFGGCITPSDYDKAIDPTHKELSVDSLRTLGTVYTGGVSANALSSLPEHQRPIMRITPGLWHMFPDATSTNYDAVDDAYEKTLAAGFRPYVDPVNPPAWATGGKGAYICEVLGSSCQILAQWGVPRERWADLYKEVATHIDDDPEGHVASALTFLMMNGITPLVGENTVKLTNTPEKIAWHFVQNYRGEQSCALAWNDPLDPSKGTHRWGDPKYAEADKFSAPRPWQLSAEVYPHGDPEAFEYMGRMIGTRYPDAVLHDYGNEPDIPLSLPPIAFDGAVIEGGPDVMRWYAEEQIRPYLMGLRAGVANALLGAPVIAGPNIAYAPTSGRFDSIRSQYTIFTGHLYADSSRWPQSSYEHAAMYAANAKASGGVWMCGEVDGPPIESEEDASPSSIVGWLRGLLALNLNPSPAGVIFYDNAKFIDGFAQQGTETSLTGRLMQVEIAGMNLRRRAARS